PYAVFALMIHVTATYGPSILGQYVKLIIAVYVACLLHAACVYSATVKLIGKYSPIQFFKNMAPAMTFAFSTASSSATLPFTMESARKCGVPMRIRAFVLPLGATVNMDGTAAFQGICALFIANAFGMPLSLGGQLQVVLAATLASIGTAGVPGAGTVMLGMVLQQVGLPVEGIALILGVDRILDMVRTMINITGDAACAIVVSKTENALLPEGQEEVLEA
ncbi:MAG: dicarboxylate/amino acid:cation symporter, partial [Oscillospiraceae bacterium]